MTTALEDTINTIIPVGAANVNLEDLRDDVLLPMATGAQWISEIVSLLNAANAAAARDALDLGTSDSPTFTGLTLTDLTVDTSVLTVIGSSNRVGVGTASPSVAFDVAVASQFTSTVSLTGVTTATNTLQLTGSGKIIVGTTTTPTVNTLAAAETLAIAGTGDGASASISRYSNDANGSRLTFFHGRGTVGSTTAVQNGDELGSVRWGGASGASTPGEGAYIRAVVSGTPGTSAMPALIEFGTAAAGEATASSRMVLSPSGQLVLGHTAAIALGSVTPGFQNHGLSQSLASMGQFIWANDSNGSVMRLGKSRGTSVGSHTIVQNADTLGQYGFWGSNGSAFVQGAQIRAVVDGSPSSTSMPTAFVISTTSSGATSVTDRVRVGSDGLTSFGTTGYGFGSTVSNALVAYSNSIEAYRVDSSQRLVVGSSLSTQAGPSSSAALVQVHSNNVIGGSGIASTAWGASGFGSRLYLSRATSGTVGTHGAVASGDPVGQIAFAGSDGTNFQYGAFMMAHVDAAPSGDMPMRWSVWTTPAGSVTPVERIRATSGGTVRPGSDNSQNLGDGSFRWGTVYAGTGTINTSDARDKEVLPGEFPEALLSAARTIADSFITYKWKDAIDAKGWYAARNHIGVTAQEVKAALESEALDPSDWALWSEEAIYETQQIDGKEVSVPVYEEDGVTPYKRMGLRHDQLAMLLLAAGLRRLNDLEARVETLESA